MTKIASAPKKVVLPKRSPEPKKTQAAPEAVKEETVAETALPQAPPGFVYDEATNSFLPVEEEAVEETTAPELPAPPPGWAYDENNQLVEVEQQTAPPPETAKAPAAEETTATAADVATAGVGVAGFGSDEILSSQFEFYAGKKGRTDRLSFPMANVKYCDVHYLEGYFKCHSLDGSVAECCTELGAPTQRVGTVALVYHTDKNGVLKSPTSYELIPWIFGPDKFNQIKAFHGDFPVSTNDVKVTCTEEKYQRLTIVPAKGQPWKELDAAEKVLIMKEANNIWGVIDKFLGRKISRTDMLERCGLSTVPEAEEEAESIDFAKTTEVD